MVIVGLILSCLFLSAGQTLFAKVPEPEVEISSSVTEAFPSEDDWFLPSGQAIKATIQNAVFSYNLQTPIIAVVDEPAACPKNGRIILPKSTRLLGTADVLKSDDRVNIRFQIAVLPNGREFEINGIALSPDGSAGIKGTVKEYKDVRLMASAVNGALLNIGQVVTANLSGQPIVGGAIGGALTQGSQEALQISNQKVDVSISVPPFQKTLVFLSHRLSLDSLKPARNNVDEKEAKDMSSRDWKKD